MARWGFAKGKFCRGVLCLCRGEILAKPVTPHKNSVVMLLAMLCIHSHVHTGSYRSSLPHNCWMPLTKIDALMWAIRCLHGTHANLPHWHLLQVYYPVVVCAPGKYNMYSVNAALQTCGAHTVITVWWLTLTFLVHGIKGRQNILHRELSSLSHIFMCDSFSYLIHMGLRKILSMYLRYVKCWWWKDCVRAISCLILACI